MTDNKHDNSEKTTSSGYFSRFGLRQVCDIALGVAAVLLIIGLFIETVVVSIIGFALFAAASAVSAVRCAVVLFRVSRGTPEYRNALIGLIAMAIVFALSLTGFVLKIMFVI